MARRPEREKIVLPELERSTRKIRDLKPYAMNARTHTAEQVERIAASIQRFGWTNAVLIKGEDDTILAGHGRVLAGDLLGIEEAPVVIARGWSEETIRAYVLADNKLALDAGWDDEILKAELAALEAAEFDMALTGFSEGELEEILRAEQEADENPDEEEDEPEQTCAQCGRVVVPDKDLTRKAKQRRKRRNATAQAHGDDSHGGGDER